MGRRHRRACGAGLYLGDRGAAAELAPLLAPVSALHAIGPVHTASHGPVALHLGRLALVTGDGGAAKAYFERAAAVGDTTFAPQFAADARAELALLSETGSPLSRRESEVARQVAKGDTNGQIATASFVSERTVESHVSSILRKLDLPSRAAVAAWVVRRGDPGPTASDRPSTR